MNGIKSYNDSLQPDATTEYAKVLTVEMERRIDAVDVLNTVKSLDGIASAQLFKIAFDGFLRYCTDSATWMHYDGVRWKRQGKDSTATHYWGMKLAKKLLLAFSDSDNKMLRWQASNLQERGKRESMVKDAKSLLSFLAEDFDKDPYLLNVQNGVIDLRTFELLPHSPELNISKLANVTYDPSADCPAFKKFFSEVLQEDADKMRYLQTMMGYCLLGENSLECAFFFYGKSARNGKSTLNTVIRTLMGEYAMNCNPETLAISDRKGSAPSPDLARLAGIRFVQVNEPPKGMRLDSSLFKDLTGNDTITARFLHENCFDFSPTFTIAFNTNHLPIITDASVFDSERIKVIPFDRHFEDAEQDKGLKNKLVQPTELSGILNWMLEGLRMYYANGDSFGETPQAVKEATMAYAKSSIKFNAFWDAVIVPDKDSSETAKHLYEAYKQWCVNAGYGVDTKADFLEWLRKQNLLRATGTIHGKTCFNIVEGITINPEALKD